jgi:hypothetical protein
MRILQRFAALTVVTVLLLQSLQGSGVMCTGHSATPHRGAAAHVMMQGDAGALAHRSALMTGSDTSPDSRSDECPDRETPRSCSTMATCAAMAALPSFEASAYSSPDEGGVIVTRLASPPLVQRAPELPPPRA